MTSTSVFNLHAGIFSAYCLLPFLLPWRFSRRGAMPRALSAQGCRLHGLPNGTRMHPFWRSCAPDIVRHSYPPRNTFHSSVGRPVLRTCEQRTCKRVCKTDKKIQPGDASHRRRRGRSPGAASGRNMKNSIWKFSRTPEIHCQHKNAINFGM